MLDTLKNTIKTTNYTTNKNLNIFSKKYQIGQKFSPYSHESKNKAAFKWIFSKKILDFLEKDQSLNQYRRYRIRNTLKLLVHYANNEKKYAYPSQKTLAQKEKMGPTTTKFVIYQKKDR